MERRESNVCPRVMKLLDDRYEYSRFMNIMWNGGDEYEVEAYSTIYVVSVGLRECSCRLWQLTGLPCPHSIPCIIHSGKTSIDLVDPCYWKSVFIGTYSNVLHPTTSPEFWENTNGMPLAPPNCVRLAGRPKKSRRRGLDEVTRVRGVSTTTRRSPQHCAICGSLNHNRRSCTEGDGSRQEQGDTVNADNNEAASEQTTSGTRGRNRGQRGGVRGRRGTGRGRGRANVETPNADSEGDT